MDMIEKESRVEALLASVRKAGINPNESTTAEQIVESAKVYLKFLQGDAAGGDSQE